MQNKRFGALSSSVDPNQLATTVVGVIRLVAGLLVTLGVLTAVDMNTLLEQVVAIVPAGVAIYSAVEIIFGIFRKIIVALTAKF